ncbi:uncharacterized protein LAESUDRAFT_705126 [Laetiporus sulphureus 93-53]|uniref:WD40 repeat-like protein n=1 Tax=Laetiporus sulphureus 93-53 TaxID=1314785 RepID=A0A165CQE5_9APHY|nr:uncharacterized protein LAESUDRAFT_705126 [Laetiporus sulphureus 93-53]KZT03232.1 hypothetical protein LAESUDRAFT_705126 [Laetiporus sulphureus 93-53]
MSNVWTPPVYDHSRRPDLIWTTHLLQSESDPSNFARAAKWCSDGTAALAQCENQSFQHVYLRPHDLSEMPGTPNQFERLIKQPSPILDFEWFPTATLRDPASFCFIASVRECPVKLLDGSDGRLRASYKIVDHRERFIAPHSLAFNMSMDKLYCGFEDAIEIFDVQSPGEGTRLHTSPSKKSRDGLKGIISALAFSRDAASGIYAAGSLNPSTPSSPNIALFSEATGETPVMFVGTESHSHGPSTGIRASVTQLMFNPSRPYLLYASFRRHDAIYAWDLRSDVSMPVNIFLKDSFTGSMDTGGKEVNDAVPTNQKLRFDIDIGGQILAAGDQRGRISIFDILTGDTASGSDEVHAVASTHSALQYEAHEDAIGSVAFHPLRPMLLSVSGSRHFDRISSNADGGLESSPSSSDEDTAINRRNSVVKISRRRPQPMTVDASVKLWCFGENTCSDESAASDSHQYTS